MKNIGTIAQKDSNTIRNNAALARIGLINISAVSTSTTGMDNRTRNKNQTTDRMNV